MKKFILLTLFCSSIAFTQIEKNIDNFNKVTSFDQIDVVLIQSNENKVVLNGKGADDVTLIIKDGELKIRMPLLKMLSGNDVSATVYYNAIDAVEANEGSRISSNDILKAIHFDVISKEGAEIKLELNVSRVTVKAASGGKIFLSGNATNQEVVLGSGAVLDAEKLSTTQTIITANAGSDATVYATEFVDAKVRAGGIITVYGNPKQLNKKTIAGGKIIKFNDRTESKN